MRVCCFLVRMWGMAENTKDSKDPLAGILSRLRDSADVTLGPGEPVVPSAHALREAETNMQILQLAQANMTYIDIARNLGLSLREVVDRITGMLKGVPLYSEEHLSAYLAHQLDLVQVGIDSSLKDMADRRDDDEVVDKIASTNRHNGRMALNKFMIHQAAILGLLRQRIDINSREQIEITIVRGEDFDAL